MDKRKTISCNETFLEVLGNCQRTNSTVYMLLDNNGLVRAEGYVREIFVDAPMPYVEMQGGMKIVLKTITGINGIFLPDYSEC